jgi:hypothetical protein
MQPETRLVRGNVVPRFWIALFVAAAATISAAGSISGQTIEMMKFVYRLSGPDFEENSSASKAITLYKAGDKYSRIEYPPDPITGDHIVGITKEPDAWTINLDKHTADHVLDAGPTFIARTPVIWSAQKGIGPGIEEFFKELEFGNEASFFQQNHPKDAGTRKIDGKDVKGLSLKNGAREVTLYLDSNTGKPLQIDVVKDGKPEISVHYISYETKLAFDPALFEIPEGLKITDRK